MDVKDLVQEKYGEAARRVSEGEGCRPIAAHRRDAALERRRPPATRLPQTFMTTRKPANYQIRL